MNNPEARAYANGQRAALEGRVEVVAHRYAAGPVSDEKSREAAGSLLRAMPYMFTSFYHPGMNNDSNDTERTIRQYHVRARTIQRILPDWKAARTAATLRSVYTTCGINGWVPGEVLSGRVDADPFSAGIPPSIFNPDGNGAHPHPDASGGHPFAVMEKNRRCGWGRGGSPGGEAGFRPDGKEPSLRMGGREHVPLDNLRPQQNAFSLITSNVNYDLRL